MRLWPSLTGSPPPLPPSRCSHAHSNPVKTRTCRLGFLAWIWARRQDRAGLIFMDITLTRMPSRASFLLYRRNPSAVLKLSCALLLLVGTTWKGHLLRLANLNPFDQEFPSIRFRAAKPGEQAASDIQSLVAQRVAVNVDDRLSTLQRSGQVPNSETCELIITDRCGPAALAFAMLTGCVPEGTRIHYLVRILQFWLRIIRSLPTAQAASDPMRGFRRSQKQPFFSDVEPKPAGEIWD